VDYPPGRYSSQLHRHPAELAGTLTAMRKSDNKVEQLEQKLNTLAWLHAELEYHFKRATIMQALQSMQPQLAEMLMSRVANGKEEATA
jgi:hypothetical protein